ncbi:MAG: glutathione S-transferase family protein [Ectothiorhodospiraceae bacterium]|nr:glutathione S-transferase family protein [Ectothiorhodospiraceae bacterium]
MLTIYGDSRSGNCLKVLWLARHLGHPHRLVEVDIMAGATRTAEFLARNPAGQVPVVELEDGRTLAQSNAIALWLADGTTLIPDDRWRRAKMHEWLFWEQYSHEPAVAVCRFRVVYQGQPIASLDPTLVAKGNAALDRMQAHLEHSTWLVDPGPTLADLALVAYTRVAHEGGFDLAPRPALRAWIARTERAFGI